MSRITIFEVGPRDGLQNEKQPVSLEDKLWFTRGLVQAGARELEIGAFVRAERVPQMADTDALYAALAGKTGGLGKARAWALVPNEKGLERAAAAGARNIAVFTAATDGFANANIGMTVRESLALYKTLIPQARKLGMRVRGYVSTAFGCPYEGKVAPAKALKVIDQLLKWDVEQVSVGDTIGVATPGDVTKLMGPLMKRVRGKAALKVAGHFHDTRGTALANALQALELGVTTLDSSAGGLGGCPYAPGATGNLATEDLVYLLHGMGLKTGFDLDALSTLSVEMSRRMNRALTSRYVAAWAAGRARAAAAKSAPKGSAP
ncbi:MAG: hydroxymethylglutaryl-CoA lyase [Bdellovibrionales bacterium]|nr:hydroxymethylglutaryl-CoA lyase [Bdellovibrionales bacterium]